LFLLGKMFFCVVKIEKACRSSRTNPKPQPAFPGSLAQSNGTLHRAYLSQIREKSLWRGWVPLSKRHAKSVNKSLFFSLSDMIHEYTPTQIPHFNSGHGPKENGVRPYLTSHFGMDSSMESIRYRNRHCRRYFFLMFILEYFFFGMMSQDIPGVHVCCIWWKKFHFFFKPTKQKCCFFPINFFWGEFLSVSSPFVNSPDTKNWFFLIKNKPQRAKLLSVKCVGTNSILLTVTGTKNHEMFDFFFKAHTPLVPGDLLFSVFFLTEKCRVWWRKILVFWSPKRRKSIIFFQMHRNFQPKKLTFFF